MIKSKTSTAEYCAGWDRIFGRKAPQPVISKGYVSKVEERAPLYIEYDKTGDEYTVPYRFVPPYEMEIGKTRSSPPVSRGRLSDSEFKAEMSRRLRKELIPDETRRL